MYNRFENNFKVNYSFLAKHMRKVIVKPFPLSKLNSGSVQTAILARSQSSSRMLAIWP